jgi:hypothetical protein
MKKIILYSFSIINLLLAIFHMSFWKLMNWSEELPKISKENQGILQIFNIIAIFIILYFAVMSFIMAKKDNIDVYGKSIIVCISGFYLIRLIAGLMFLGFSYVELSISAMCALIIAGYLFVLFEFKKNK